ncbi:MotB family protein [Oricola sp.]|uniref:MotB family protein n=1 Tax=Oricola sp. TaxID=1979950 RepID=UPI003BA843EF
MNDGEKHQEIIIIKRGGDGEEGHHGGAWKIAFADFMTAMMALFLVLWLINAANEETKKAVASYFNPVKLVDRNRSVKGLHDAEGVQDVEMTTPNEQFPETENKETPTETISENQTEAEAQFFSDPFAALDEIAAHEVPGIAKSIEEEGGRNGDLAINDAEGGESFMDPFSPNFWNEEVRHANDNRQLAGNFETSGEADDAADEMRLEVPATTEEIGGQAGLQGDPEAQLETASLNAEDGDTGGAAAKQARLPRQIELEDAAGAETKPEDNPEGNPEDNPEDMAAMADTKPGDGEDGATEMAETSGSSEAADPLEAAAEALRRAIGERLAEEFGAESALAEELNVVARDDGILISLTDNIDVAMYDVGSAIPSRDLVVAMEKIGAVLADQRGGIRIRGHTDARPFRSDAYDNWRLSAARAQSAYYMLLRGGLEETRVREITGFADRQLLVGDNPLSPKNRRIEVLVEVDRQ